MGNYADILRKDISFLKKIQKKHKNLKKRSAIKKAEKFGYIKKK